MTLKLDQLHRDPDSLYERSGIYDEFRYLNYQKARLHKEIGKSRGKDPEGLVKEWEDLNKKGAQLAEILEWTKGQIRQTRDAIQGGKFILGQSRDWR